MVRRHQLWKRLIVIFFIINQYFIILVKDRALNLIFEKSIKSEQKTFFFILKYIRAQIYIISKFCY